LYTILLYKATLYSFISLILLISCLILIFTCLYSITVSEQLFLKGLAAVFKGLLTSSQLTAYCLLFALHTAQLKHCAPISRLHNSYSSSFCADFKPPHFPHPLSLLDLENVFKECPRLPLTPSRLLYTYYPLTYLLTLLFSLL
jgi:hypothetical protein